MIEHQGVWLPDGETHLTNWMTTSGEIVDGKGTYQIKKLRAAVAHCENLRTAVDVGAHCGMWSMQLRKQFNYVHAFEPVAAHRECFMRNVPNAEQDAMQNVTLHPCALGAHEGRISIVTEPTSSGDSRVGGNGDIPMITLDSLNLKDVDFMKIDCEGYELYVLAGAVDMLHRCRPVVIVEQKKGHAQQYGLRETQAVEWLRERSYEQVREMSGDFIMVHK